MNDPKYPQNAHEHDDSDTGETLDVEEILEEQTTDENGKPLENPSGG
jgi:hypothetical protein